MTKWIGIDLLQQVFSREEAFRRYPWLKVDWIETQPSEGFFLSWSRSGLHLKSADFDLRSSVHIDFVSGPQARRIKAVSGETLTRAIGCQKGLRPAVVDATAGIGSDMSVLANIGCSVIAFERNPVIAALLADALLRANESSISWVQRVILNHGNAANYLSQVKHGVLYLDPMFPEDRKTVPTFVMQIFRILEDGIDDQNTLFEAAMDSCCSRLVVKRPLKAPPLNDCEPSSQIKGKTVRFDLYPKRKLTQADCVPHKIKL